MWYSKEVQIKSAIPKLLYCWCPAYMPAVHVHRDKNYSNTDGGIGIMLIYSILTYYTTRIDISQSKIFLKY